MNIHMNSLISNIQCGIRIYSVGFFSTKFSFGNPQQLKSGQKESKYLKSNKPESDSTQLKLTSTNPNQIGSKIG